MTYAYVLTYLDDLNEEYAELGVYTSEESAAQAMDAYHNPFLGEGEYYVRIYEMDGNPDRGCIETRRLVS